MGALASVYERTGLCPHTAACDSFSAIVNSESWMERTLSGLRRGGGTPSPGRRGAIRRMTSTSASSASGG